jgi:hypothetical protein
MLPAVINSLLSSQKPPFIAEVSIFESFTI